MKAERRHELKHNELSDWLGERLEALKPHATGVVLGLVLLGVIVVGGAWYFSGERHAASKAWSRYFDSFNEREPQKALEDLAKAEAGSKAAWWALAAVGDMHLGQGAALLYSDRAEAQKHLEQAKAAYLRVEAAEDQLLKNRARLGLAKVHESLCQAEEARKYYEQVAAAEKDSAIGKAAAADAARLADPREVAFLDWFAKQTPKRPAPMSGFGGAIPGMPNDLPDRPDISLKGFGLDNLGTSPPQESATTFPPPSPALPSATAAEPTPPDTTKPADSPPSNTPPNSASPETPPSDSAKAADPPTTERKSD